MNLVLTPEQEARIEANARAMGIDPEDYLRRVIDDLPRHPNGPRPGETLYDGLKRIGVLGSVSGQPRPDGKAWSECEGFE